MKEAGKLSVNVQAMLSFSKVIKPIDPGSKKRSGPEPEPSFRHIGQICTSAKVPVTIYRVEKRELGVSQISTAPTTQEFRSQVIT